MFNDFNKMKSFSLDILVLKETIAKIEISIKNIEKIGTDVENIGDKLIFESWEGNATNSFKEHQQDWKKGYDEMLNQLIDFKQSLGKVVLVGAEEINELALELPTPLGGSKGAGYRNIISMEQEGIEELKGKCKTLVYEDYEYQREIMGTIEGLSNRLNYSFSIGADASKNKRTIEENQEKLQAFKGKLQNYEDRVLLFEKEVVDEMSKYAVVCGKKLDSASFREVLKYQKDDAWKVLLTKKVEGLSDIEKLVLKSEYESGITDKISQYINKRLGIEALTFKELNEMLAKERGSKVSDIFSGVANILNTCKMAVSPIELTLGKDLEYVMLPFTSLEKSSNDVNIKQAMKKAFNTLRSVPISPIYKVDKIYQLDQAISVFNNGIDGIAALIQGNEVTWSNKGILYSLDQAFDKTENYDDKFAEGNISGCYLNFGGETLGFPQSILLNACNNCDSLMNGEGLQSWNRKMDYSDYEKECYERRGERPFSETFSEEHKYLGFGYIVLMNILTDPLFLLGGEKAAVSVVEDIVQKGAKVTTWAAEIGTKGASGELDTVLKQGDNVVNGMLDVEKAAKGSSTADNIIEGGSKTSKGIKSWDDISTTLEKEGLTKSKVDEILNTPKANRPEPSTYLSDTYINEHLSNFQNGVTKIKSRAPIDTEGVGLGTFVMPKATADDVISRAGGDVSKLEELLALNPGDLGKNPVRVDIANPQNVRIPSGNEAGAWPGFWTPGGYTKPGGVIEAVIDPVSKNNYIVTENILGK